MKINITEMVSTALAEDLGETDITSALIPDDKVMQAKIISKQSAIICGCEWVNETFKQLDPDISITWLVKDGEYVKPYQEICLVNGHAKHLLSAERVALNFLQTLSGTATLTNEYSSMLEGLPVKLLDTRKTIPLWRLAQKYAVICGGGHNHRVNLEMSFLIKENHINALGGITPAIKAAKQTKLNKPIEIEVENLDEYKEAVKNKPDIIMLDNFSLSELRQAAILNKGKKIKLEASGNITLDNLAAIAATGVDYISIGAITKNIQAIDLSMRYFSNTKSNL